LRVQGLPKFECNEISLKVDQKPYKSRWWNVGLVSRWKEMKKRGIRGITTTIAVVIAIVTLVVGLLIGMVLQAQLGVFEPARVGLTGDVEIGALLPATGDLATFGANAKSAITLAETEINDFLDAADAGWTLKLVHEDSATDAVIALERTESLFARGIEFIVGPQASDCVASIKDYCDSNEILVVSPSSTRPGLNVPDDFLFRFCPTDLIQGPAIARLIDDDDVTKIIAVYRDDAWGLGLHDATKARFEQPALGGEFIESIGYDPDAPGFDTIAATLDTEVASAISTYGADNVGVLYIAFEEVVQFFTECAVYSPDGWGVKWYGSDGTAKSADMVADLTTATFSYQTGFINPIFSPTKSDKFQKVEDYVVGDLGRSPDSYAFACYDIVWALAISLMTVDKYDASAVRDVLADVTESIFGASGWVVLNADGDRAASDYDLWVMDLVGTEYEWTYVGKYVQATDSIAWE
jgi:branched-chain amino acid transport system substrate-binding protein